MSLTNLPKGRAQTRHRVSDEGARLRGARARPRGPHPFRPVQSHVLHRPGRTSVGDPAPDRQPRDQRHRRPQKRRRLLGRRRKGAAVRPDRMGPLHRGRTHAQPRN